MTKQAAEQARDDLNREFGIGTHYVELQNGEWSARQTPWFRHPNRPPSNIPAPISIFCG